MSLVETRKAIVEITSKQLEYITKSHIAIYNIVLNLKRLYSLVPFSSLVLLLFLI